MLKLSALPDRYQTLLRRLRTSFQNQRWQWIIGLVAFTLINGYILYRLSREWHTINDFDWSALDARFLLPAATVQFVGLLIAIGAWGYILRRAGHPIPFRRHFKIYTLANLARKLPGGLGVDLLSRVYLYDRDGGNRVTISFATLIEPLILAVSATIVLLITLILPGGSSGLINPLVPVAGMAAFLIIVPSPIFRTLLARVSRIPPEHQQLRWHHMLHWALMNGVTIALGGLTLFLFCRAFGVVGDADVLTLIQYWALVVVSGVLFVWLPIDVGASSSVTILILATIMPMPQALIMLVVWRLWSTLSELVWGAIGFVL